MMCDICHEGGQVLGPFLKPMTHLVHTEYLLAGRTRSDVRDVLRDTMFAATVTGAPVENACRLIHEYESEGRGYYAGALALIGRDEEGAPTADSPIVIRTADVSPDGAMKVTAGATLVRDSEPEHEVAETQAKAGGILSAFGLVPGAPGAPSDIADLTLDEDVLIALNSRNQRLAKFWLTDQAGAPPAPSLAGRTIAILHGEDDFVNMLAHVFSVLGMGSRVVRHEALLEEGAEGIFDDVDLVVVGPGPGDPRDHEHPKIAAYRKAIDALLASGKPFLAVCLGHQVLCDRLGISLDYKDIVFQGTQSSVEIDGREERVGFYNTFVGRLGEEGLPDGVRVESDPATGDIHLWPDRTSAACSSTPSRSSPRTASPCSASCCWSCWGDTPVVEERASRNHRVLVRRPLRLLHLEPRAPHRRGHRRASRGRRARHARSARARPVRAACRALARAGPSRGRGRLRPRPGGVLARRAGARRLPGHAGPGHVVRRNSGRGSSRPTARSRR